MGGLIVGIDGGRGPVATGALIRARGGTASRTAVTICGLFSRHIPEQVND
jgi:hypothetical protein